MSLAKHGDGKGQALAREEWDFSNIPPGELKACFLYEYARESPTILAFAREMEGYEYTDYSDQSEPNFYKLAHRHNYDCAVLLADIGLELKLATTPWQALNAIKRASLAQCVRKAPCFRQVRFEDAYWWEEVKKRDPDLLERMSSEIVPIRIDWGQPFGEIEKQALTWLRSNPRAKKPKRKRGRHATEDVQHKDALRRLGALRLWSRHPLKQAMRITKDCGVKLYSTYLDSEERPAHQTAWQNGVDGVKKLLRNTFTLDKPEMPLSWQLLQKRRMRKYKSA